MDFTDLPAELRVQIYSHLPDLRPGRRIVVGPRTHLLPAICQVSRQTRHETVPLYAGHCHFAVECYDRPTVRPWTQALGAHGLGAVGSVQLSRHWRILRPSQGQGHVGFYLRLERSLDDGTWRCTTGTYPFAKDTRGMRLQSIDLLRRMVMDGLALEGRGKAERGLGLSADDFEFVAAAMEIVASHPIEGHDFQRLMTAMSHKQQMDVWASMEAQLRYLAAPMASPGMLLLQ
nr:hypothetical protein CFP56_34700 [Quercus suber]